MKIVQVVCSVLICLNIIFYSAITGMAADNVEQQHIKIGFFSADGYHIMDDNGTMSGYGYDFLQMMLRYNNWQYEYIGYDKNWGDMLSMLDSGQLDMVTLANKTPEREKLFAYSEKSIGTSSTIMTISSNNSDIIPGKYNTYDGRKIGLVTGSSHNPGFEKYAMEHSFTYIPVYYEDINDLLNDLRSGNNIDIAVTSNMRLVHDEIILSEFNANEYYAIVKRGNDKLLEDLNNGIAQLNVYSPDWRTALFKKYYSDINSNVISLSLEEREYLAELSKSGRIIKVAMNPELAPYAYFENGQAKGIAPEIFKEIAERLGISYEIIEADNRWQYKEQLISGEADVDLTAYLDYSMAQRYNLKETDAYIRSYMAMLHRKNSNTDPASMVVAIVREPTEYIGYNNDLIYRYKYKEYESIQECIDAVKNGEADATFRYVYIAEAAVNNDYTNTLKYTVLPQYSFGLCLGVGNNIDHRLLSILNKGVTSLNDSFASGVILEQTTNLKKNNSLLAFVYANPLLTMLLVTIFIVILCLAVMWRIRYQNEKSKLLAAREMNRFISYACESYELLSEINLDTKRVIDYKLVNKALVEEESEYVTLDEAYFKKIAMPDDVAMLTEAFKEENINKLIKQGGAENYFECQLKNSDGEYNWYSYIIKAVVSDKQHPRNFVIFKKNIQSFKQREAEQRDILKDALETAKQASKAKGRFLARVSHEIRTPLNAVIGYMQLAKETGNDHDRIMHCIEQSDSAAKHLLCIINDVLDISSIESGRMKMAKDEFDLKGLLKAISSLFFNQAQQKNIRFEVVIKELAQEWVVGDEMRVKQILFNLLSNAVKFTNQNGYVTLTVTQANDKNNKIFIKFSVSDTGIGMSEAFLEKIFIPFEQETADIGKKYGGTGLGMSITQNLVNMMGGSIEVISKQNVGTVFNVSLQFDKCVNEHNNTVTVQDYSHVHVLIVDDDEVSCQYMQSLLDRCKVKSESVNSGQQAVAMIKEKQGTAQKYDLCIMDWNMPEMNGIETARRIKQECDTDMPIVIATAYDVSEFTEQAKQLGIEKLISKPLFQSTMFNLLVSTYGKYEPVNSDEAEYDNIEGLHVMLAEDNPLNMEISVAILEMAGIVVEQVTDGKQALDKFLAEPPGTFDAILMDIQMPVMDGFQATIEIRKSEHADAKQIPIIAVSANAFVEDVNAALASGMNEHVAKPVDYDKLYSVLNKYCRK